MASIGPTVETSEESQFKQNIAIQRLFRAYEDIFGNASEGDVLYRGPEFWARLPRGSNGEVLTLTAGIPDWAMSTGTGGRVVLAADRTYFVRTDGSDSNTGLVDSAGGAFLTIQKAVNTFYTLDGGGFAGTIQVRSGTYAGGVLCTAPFLGFSTVTLLGDNTTPANVVISSGSVICIDLQGDAILYIRGFKLTTSGGTADCVKCTTGGSAVINGNMNYGACAEFHLYTQDSGSSITVSTNYTISGGAVAHYVATINSSLTVYPTGLTITLTGTPAFTYFAFADRTAVLNNFGEIFTGAATGQVYIVISNAVIFTQAGGPTYFPGNVAGAMVSGGQYV